ncbi:S49 family peptidase [Arsenicibacter rosenii]|nr:S49 family peptidase [Arsenicibacter rosenii]
MNGVIFSGLYAVDRQLENNLKAAILGGGISAKLAGHPLMASAEQQAASGFTWEGYYANAFSIGKAKDVVVIPVQGTMSRGWTWDNYFSNEFMMSMLAHIAEDESKKGVIMRYNTGGGSVDSTDEFAAAVRAFNQVKPSVGLINYCASAGFWVGSQNKELVMMPNSVSRVGSIGTIYIHTNIKKALDQQGYDVQIFRSTGSSDKARINPIEELDPELEQEIQRDLDSSNKAFKSEVRRGRGAKITSDEIYTGKMYGVDGAIQLGLADAKGDLPYAYNRVLQLSKQK